MNIISAQYSKEIDTLRQQLSEANNTNDTHERTRMMTQENLKKAFMKGVCAMNMEAMTILNPNEHSDMERKFETLAENVFSESTPIRQLAFNNSSSTEYKVYDSNVKDEDIYKKFGMHVSDAHDSDKSSVEESIHHTPQDRNRTQQHEYTEEKDMKHHLNGYTELETASMSKNNFASSAVKISRPGDDIVINNSKIESKDSLWKPAPMMSNEPMIVNNVHASSSFGYKSNNSSLNPSGAIPKHTLGLSNYQNSGSNSSMTHMNSNPNYAGNYQQISRSKNNNLDLIESLSPHPYPHPGKTEPSYQQIGRPAENIQVVKENVSSNVMESLHSSGLPSVMNKTTTSAGGKTIRINNR